MKITKEMIISCAISMISEEKIENFNARSLAKRLNCSTQPIFYNFSSMDEVLTEAGREIYRRYEAYITSQASSGKYPPYKASGMAYITYAKENPNLFRFVFMRDRTGEDKSGDLTSDIDAGIISGIVSTLGISETEARKFHREMWIFVHGIAVMLATGFADYTEAEISDMMSDIYTALAEKRKPKSISSLFKGGKR